MHNIHHRKGLNEVTVQPVRSIVNKLCPTVKEYERVCERRAFERQRRAEEELSGCRTHPNEWLSIYTYHRNTLVKQGRVWLQKQVYKKTSRTEVRWSVSNRQVSSRPRLDGSFEFVELRRKRTSSLERLHALSSPSFPQYFSFSFTSNRTVRVS